MQRPDGGIVEQAKTHRPIRLCVVSRGSDTAKRIHRMARHNLEHNVHDKGKGWMVEGGGGYDKKHDNRKTRGRRRSNWAAIRVAMGRLILAVVTTNASNENEGRL